jgi:hypothetical protein
VYGRALPGLPGDEPGQILEAAAAQAGHHRSVEPVQELPPAPAFDEEGDELSRRPMAQDPHAPGYARLVPDIPA